MRIMSMADFESEIISLQAFLYCEHTYDEVKNEFLTAMQLLLLDADQLKNLIMSGEVVLFRIPLRQPVKHLSAVEAVKLMDLLIPTVPRRKRIRPVTPGKFTWRRNVVHLSVSPLNQQVLTKYNQLPVNRCDICNAWGAGYVLTRTSLTSGNTYHQITCRPCVEAHFRVYRRRRHARRDIVKALSKGHSRRAE